jgi:hypothetical protein
MKKIALIAISSLLAIVLLLSGCAETEYVTVTATETITTTETRIPSLTIYSPEQGDYFNVNVQKVFGIVSNPEAAVQVNGNDAIVSADGSFYAYVELFEGENTVTASAVLNGKSCTDAIVVNFTPSLSVYLTIVPEEDEVNYLITPLTVTGIVSSAEAAVTVDGIPVAVSADGTFTTRVLLNTDTVYILATAGMNGREVSYYCYINVTEDGRLSAVPVWQFYYLSSLHCDGEIQLAAGEKGYSVLSLYMRQSLTRPAGFRWEVYPISVNEKDEISLPAGITIDYTPSEFTVYPNTSYSLLFNVSTTSDVVPGVYYFKLGAYLNDVEWSGDSIKVIVS